MATVPQPPNSKSFAMSHNTTQTYMYSPSSDLFEGFFSSRMRMDPFQRMRQMMDEMERDFDPFSMQPPADIGLMSRRSLPQSPSFRRNQPFRIPIQEAHHEDVRRATHAPAQVYSEPKIEEMN